MLVTAGAGVDAVGMVVKGMDTVGLIATIGVGATGAGVEATDTERGGLAQ